MAQKKFRVDEQESGETLVLEREQTEEPRKYVVILHNDDFTTQEFVVHILTDFFHKSLSEAHQLMLKVHREGKAKVGLYTKDIAETKVVLISSYSRQHGMPLLISAEPE